MADSQRQNPVEPPGSKQVERAFGNEAPTAGSPGRMCAECGSPQLTLVSDGDLVAIFRCPACGHLSAPVKER